MKRVTRFLIVMALVAWAVSSFADAPDVLWTQTFGGINTDYGYCVRQTNDGGFILAGYGVNGGAPDNWLIKTDANGDSLWSHYYGGMAPETPYSVEQTTDDGYIMGGYTFSYGAGAMDFYLVKTDENGDTLWTSVYGGYNIDYGSCVKQTTDGGYIFVGYTASYGAGSTDVYLIKTNSLGTETWSQTYGGVDTDEGFYVQQTADGGYILTGSTMSYGAGSFDVYLIKTNADGTPLWERTFGGSGSEKAYCVEQTADGGYIILGSTESYGAGPHDWYMIKTDSNGNESWYRTFGGIGVNDFGECVRQLADGGYIMLGYTDSFGAGEIDYWLIRTDANGDTLWTQTYGGILSEKGYSVDITDDGGYILFGETFSYGAGNMDYYLIRLDTETPPIALTLTPANPPVQVASGGGSFYFDVEISNFTTTDHVIDVWTDITLPSGVNYPVFNRENIDLVGGGTITRSDLEQYVPGTAMAGQYSYNGYVRDHDTWQLLVQDSFPFEKLAGDDLPNHNMGWALLGWEDDETELVALPSASVMLDAYPNPFNPSTMVNYNLQDASLVNISVYDITGSLITDLVKGWRDAGTHELTFDAEGLAAGIYFVRLTTGDLTRTHKLLLIK